MSTALLITGINIRTEFPQVRKDLESLLDRCAALKKMPDGRMAGETIDGGSFAMKTYLRGETETTDFLAKFAQAESVFTTYPNQTAVDVIYYTLRGLEEDWFDQKFPKPRDDSEWLELNFSIQGLLEIVSNMKASDDLTIMLDVKTVVTNDMVKTGG